MSHPYLGVQLSDDLRWDTHINYATSKAGRVLGVIRRNSTHCPSRVKATCYKELVRPHLEYSATVWDPYTTKGIQAVEAVQRRAARVTLNDYRRTSSVTQMLRGHTAEILRLMRGLSDTYAPRYYIIAETDQLSEEKVHRFEREKYPGKKDMASYEVQKVPRSREMAQSWLSSVFTTLYATLYSIPLVFRTSPDLFLGLTKVSLVYVEMFCRVETLSLSAQLLYYLADHFLVQWPQLHQRFPRTTYIGRVI
ncbi:ALG14 [Branchiostoma lanceolatum]|uniref:UDP-N-acetylglucosamine transferase subunit ALG14 n=1 Tax=Branchiostoma lanceolatum TaxID=7740 RepID=A0A8K0AGW0_BRALA|nr:ALG14 [Branchiostoma lanceolatum]